jgi:hypothetical protein
LGVMVKLLREKRQVFTRVWTLPPGHLIGIWVDI